MLTDGRLSPITKGSLYITSADTLKTSRLTKDYITTDSITTAEYRETSKKFETKNGYKPTIYSTALPPKFLRSTLVSLKMSTTVQRNGPIEKAKTVSLIPKAPTTPEISKVSDYISKKMSSFTSTIIQSKIETNSLKSIKDESSTKSIIEGSERYS